ncbi:MAG TPA: hypothetical protein VGM91_16395 [Conexibacter sp.]|jgi:ABC-type multidrug transport system permease subunit
MSDIQRRSSNRPSRRQREQRAYQLVLATGVLSVIAVVGIVLAVATSFSWSVGIIAAILAVVCYMLFRRNVGN